MRSGQTLTVEGPAVIPAGEPIIELSGVTFRYPGAEADSLQEVSLTIRAGDFVAVAGSNGSGKSTLCKSFNGLIPHYYHGDIEGEVRVCGVSVAGRTVAELSRSVAYVFQDFENQLVRPTVMDEVSFAPLNYGHTDYKERGLRALQMLDIEPLSRQWIWQLSGGQKHMVALAAALALDPEVIVVDEPVAQFDPAHARIIYDKLRRLNADYGKTIVVIEHHTEFIADYCRTMVLMGPGGRVRWVKPIAEGLAAAGELSEMNIQPPQVTQAYVRLTEHSGAARYDEETLDSQVDMAMEIDPGQAADMGTGTPMEAHPSQAADVASKSLTEDSFRVPVTLDDAAGLWGALVRSGDAPEEEAWASRPQVPAAGEELVRFRQVTAGYQSIDRGRTPVLRGIDLTVREGDRIALVGNNGAGKSTLMRLIAGLRKPWSGEVTVCGHATSERKPEQLADQVSFLFQNPEEMFIADNIREDIAYFLRSRKRTDADTFTDQVMARFKLTALRERDGRLLSGGQQRRATLAIGMAMRPAVLLLDEPTASLDIASRRELTGLLDELRDTVRAVMVATHDMQLVADWANRVIVMHEGRVLLDTDSRTLFSRADVLERAALIPPQIVQLSQRLGLSPPCLSVDEFVNYMRLMPGEES